MVFYGPILNNLKLLDAMGVCIDYVRSTMIRPFRVSNPYTPHPWLWEQFRFQNESLPKALETNASASLIIAKVGAIIPSVIETRKAI